MQFDLPLISVVIPIYNGEKYLEETLNSLLSQSYTNFEVVCVNDSSTDSSLEIIENYARLDRRIRVYTKTNGGTSAKSVNYGLQFADGEYFMYSSQDDLFSSDLIEKNVLRLLETGADVAIPEMRYYYDADNCEKGIVGIKGDKSRELIGREAFVLSLNWTIHGFALWSMETIRKVGIGEYGLNSDEYATRMFYFNSNKVVFSEGKFFYRQGNPNAITSKWSISQLDYIKTCNKIETFLIENGFGYREIAINRQMLVNEFIRIMIKFKSVLKSLSKQERLYTYKKIKSLYKINRSKFSDIKGLKRRIILFNWISFDFITTCFQLIKKNNKID